MPYNILRLSTIQPDAYPRYFLDSNVWVYALQPRVALTRHAIPYADFVDDVIQLHLNGSPLTPKFVWTSTLLSEVINAMLRVACDNYRTGLRAAVPPNFSYKTHFRPTPAFASALNRIRSDLQGYEPYVEVQDDGLTGLDVFGSLLPGLTATSDFTDLLYFRQMLPQGVPIVTNDGDFAFENLPIITSHPDLLRLV